jgi:hypothetical protein
VPIYKNSTEFCLAHKKHKFKKCSSWGVSLLNRFLLFRRKIIRTKLRSIMQQLINCSWPLVSMMFSYENLKQRALFLYHYHLPTRMLNQYRKKLSDCGPLILKKGKKYVLLIPSFNDNSSGIIYLILKARRYKNYLSNFSS